MLGMESEWGVTYMMDLKYCNAAVTRSRQSIQDYVIALCKQLELEREGDCNITVLADNTVIISQVLADGLLWGKFLSTISNCSIGIVYGHGFDLIAAANYTFDFFQAKEIATHYSVKH